MDNPSNGMNTKKIAIIACFIALSSSLRLLKYVAIGPIQFVNFPAIFTIMGGLAFGLEAGGFIGVLTFVASDFLIGSVGYWTIYTAICMGLVGCIASLMRRIDEVSSPLCLGVCSYLLVFTYDILSSILFWALMVPLNVALVLALVGLFLPSSVTLYPIGLVTEIVTVALIVLIYPRVKNMLKEVAS